MNFKDLQYSLGKLTTDVRSQIARNNPLQKQDTKTLSLWIFGERNDLATMRTSAYQRSETNKVFKQWTKEECQNEKGNNGQDLEDIGDKLVKLLDKQVEIEQNFAGKYQRYRHAIKSIREREDKLSDIREKKRSLQARIANLSKSNARSPKQREFEKELQSLERDTHDIELEMGDFKRFALKEAFYLRFNALNEYAEKLRIIAGFGKYIVDLLDIEPTPPGQQRRPYEKGPEAAMILADALLAVDQWQPDGGDERPTLAVGGLESTLSFADDASELGDEKIQSKGKGRADSVVAGGLVGASASENVVETQPSPLMTTPPPPPPRPSIGDVKSAEETEIDLEKLDLYDVPPPAYSPNNDNAANADLSSPRNSDEPPVIRHHPPYNPTNVSAPPNGASMHEEKQQVEEEPTTGQGPPPPPLPQRPSPPTPTGSGTFESPYQAHMTPPGAPHLSPQVITQSPQPMHNYQTYHHSSIGPGSNAGHHTAPGSQGSLLYTPTTPGGPQYHQANYYQLYRQVSHRQKHAPPQRPYAEFQQQFNYHSDGGYYRQRTDAGGFRIPDRSSTHETAEEEKRRLGEQYAEQDRRAFTASRPSVHTDAGGFRIPPSSTGNTAEEEKRRLEEHYAAQERRFTSDEPRHSPIESHQQGAQGPPAYDGPAEGYPSDKK
ncbi:Eisosome component PIL1-domain-containing protein [Radiomyces spectabilis]|uniref:Eisosome component PIL1-domain-containing protein n=1 Tax=Radiomyces spectabilis TaxID=64574 RepID=UPI00221F82CD|nr:Eisosome component PIL1-domain-containing protein [Radiomyces spectabilis]KAI8367629.1 Eisosome component PIL1-domain-containing protein [Radiomyces spectabilis]